MPTLTVNGSVTLQEAVDALHGKLGDHYEVTTTRRHGAQEALKVTQSAASIATVRLDQDEHATTFHIHGGGLLISRMVNELGIAKKVTRAIDEAFATDSESPPQQ